MSQRSSRRNGNPEATNPIMPVTTPNFGAQDNWTIKALNDLTVAVGKIEVSIEHLSEKIGEVKVEQQATINRIQTVENKMLVASAVLGVLMVIGSIALTCAGYVGNKAIDFGMEMAKESLSSANPPAQQSTLAPAPAPAPAPARK